MFGSLTFSRCKAGQPRGSDDSSCKPGLHSGQPRPACMVSKHSLRCIQASIEFLPLCPAARVNGQPAEPASLIAPSPACSREQILRLTRTPSARNYRDAQQTGTEPVKRIPFASGPSALILALMTYQAEAGECISRPTALNCPILCTGALNCVAGTSASKSCGAKRCC